MPPRASRWPSPVQRVGDVREMLAGQRYESASHIVVCEADTFLGIVTIEELLFAARRRHDGIAHGSWSPGGRAWRRPGGGRVARGSPWSIRAGCR